MIPFLTEIAEFIVALLMLAATQPILKKSNAAHYRTSLHNFARIVVEESK